MKLKRGLGHLKSECFSMCWWDVGAVFAPSWQDSRFRPAHKHPLCQLELISTGGFWEAQRCKMEIGSESVCRLILNLHNFLAHFQVTTETEQDKEHVHAWFGCINDQRDLIKTEKPRSIIYRSTQINHTHHVFLHTTSPYWPSPAINDS